MDPIYVNYTGTFVTVHVFWARGYKTFSMLNSAEHEIFPAQKC